MKGGTRSPEHAIKRVQMSDIAPLKGCLDNAFRTLSGMHLAPVLGFEDPIVLTKVPRSSTYALPKDSSRAAFRSEG